MRLAAQLTPRGGRDAARDRGRDHESRGFLKVRVAAPPVEGEANAALIALLARALRRPRSDIGLAAGRTGRLRLVEIADLREDDMVGAHGSPP